MSSSAGSGSDGGGPDPADAGSGWPPPPPPSGQRPTYPQQGDDQSGPAAYPSGPATSGSTPYAGQPTGPGGQGFSARTPYPAQPGSAGPGFSGPSPYSGQPPYPAQPGSAGPGYAGSGPYPGQPSPYGTYPQGAPSYPGSGYDGSAPPGGSGWSGWAIAAFVCGCIPWVGILAAIPLGIVALVKIGKSGQRGKALAIVGMVISVLIWVATIGLGFFVLNNTAKRDSSGHITNAGRIDFSDIRTGDCVQINGINSGSEVGLLDVTGVPCSDTHNAESVGAVTISGDSYPGYDTMTQQAQSQCGQLASSYVDPSKVSGLQPYLFAPSKDLWNSDVGAHRVVCLVTNTDYSNIGGSVAG